MLGGSCDHFIVSMGALHQGSRAQHTLFSFALSQGSITNHTRKTMFMLNFLFCGTWEALITWDCCSTVLELLSNPCVLNGMVRGVFIALNHPNSHWDQIPKSALNSGAPDLQQYKSSAHRTSATPVGSVTILILY